MKNTLILSVCILGMMGCETLNDKAVIRSPKEPFGSSVNAPFTAMVSNARQPDPVVGRVYFSYDNAELTEVAKQELDMSACAIARRQGSIVVEGYADHNNTDEYNLRLGYQRALAVADYLRSAGVWDERMVIKSFGETRPTTTNWKSSGQPLNRCVVIRLFAQGEGINGKEGSNQYQKITRPLSVMSETSAVPASLPIPEMK